MYRIIMTPQAQQDIDGHIDYIFARNPQGAQKVYDDIINRIRKLRDFPLVSRIGALQGTREVFTRYTYRVVFEIIGEEIYILHVRHGRQQWPPEEEEDDDA
jgi:addiction module RelE/StbE family toxin